MVGQDVGVVLVGDAYLRDFLLRQDQRWLVEELLRAAQGDTATAARLKRAAGVPRDVAAELEEIRLDLRDAIELDRFVGWRGAASYAEGVVEVLERVRGLLDDRLFDAALVASEDALRLIEESAEYVDDSGGNISDLLDRAGRIHLAACQGGRPDPVDLGERLARWALRSELGIFVDSPQPYATVLGEAGLASFERVVDEGWRKVPPRLPGDEEPASAYSRLTVVKEALASLHGVDALVEVIAHDLSSPHRFVRVASALAEADRVEEAIRWLDRGRDAFAKRHDAGLTELAADLHARAGRPGAATALAWNAFRADPTLQTYQRLATFAKAANTWAQRREAALKLLRSQPTAVKTAADNAFRPSSVEPRGHSVLVEVLLSEGDDDGAWVAAGRGGATASLWLRLAHVRGRTHPDDAVPILQTEILRTIQGAERPAYLAAAALAQELRRYARACGRSDEFDDWIRHLRATNPHKRAMQEEFDRAGLPS